ncbi:hypothetical protein BOX15_Mlig033890g1 [Macrostomum lignano]|uniref:Uncharacterized protein n=1 Tax=Macrostomum lignano TaxID=282301 RepID=A0A267GQM1_9PLAT|nr:hypothetical protein BOX15_Mlig033890g1 [Macrostomum lignano]
MGVVSKLRAALVMSDDADASRSNLVCGQTQQWMSENVEWSSEGAKLDGVSSKMWLENVEFANLQQGLTWLVRLKREIGDAPILESYDCTAWSGFGAAFWDGASRGLFGVRIASSYSSYQTALETNFFDANSSVEVGLTSASVSSRTFFSNGGFVPPEKGTVIGSYTASVIPNCTSLRLGFQRGDSRMLNGTVQAVAVMNDSMTEAEIRSFFGLVR